jgi:Tat protein secretion system quality control protein TatD with DNase activity
MTENSEFPWHLGLYDAHCHPTDIMKRTPQIATMKTKTVTMMASRSQDQDLVAQVATQYGMVGKDTYTDDVRVIPSFGWHPWFSYQLYDDLNIEKEETLDRSSEAFKLAHYESVLTPTPDDQDFLLSLPQPRPLSQLLASIRANLEKFPLALVGEVGVDRSFRLPGGPLVQKETEEDFQLTPGGREGRGLTKYHVKPEHQRCVLEEQLKLAAELQRPVSVHGVKAQALLTDILMDSWKGCENRVLSRRKQKELYWKQRLASGSAHDSPLSRDTDVEMKDTKPFPPRICLHSYSGSPEGLTPFLDPKIPAAIFFSFSMGVNFPTTNEAKWTHNVIKAVPADQILVESDLHMAGPEMDSRLQEVTQKVCQIKGWELEEGVLQLGTNWKRFVLGDSEDDSKSEGDSSMIIEIN